MTVGLLERQEQSQSTLAEMALPIIDAYRGEFDDHTAIAPLDVEFPYWETDGSTYLLDAGDNKAGAFKWRGALVGAMALKQAGHDRLVVPSAGNHARGAVLAAKVLNMSVDVVVPRSAPPAKREGIKSLWQSERNRVHINGATFDESLEYGYQLAEERGGALLHPYDDQYVAAGQGTIVDDLLRQKPDVDHVVLPVGGGGLLAGVAERMTALGRNDVHLTVVEASGSDSFSRSLGAGAVVAATAPNSAYGGSAVMFTGRMALDQAQGYPNLRVVTADEDDMRNLIAGYEQSRIDLDRTDRHYVPAFEPTSLVAVAGLRQVAEQYKSTVVVGTGHNAPLPV